jgi:lipopolysaccharide transport system permease protein
VFALTGMSAWLFVSSALSQTATSAVASATLISKVYFPRLAIPLAALVPPMVDLAVAVLVLLVAMAIYGVVPSAGIVLLPAVLALTALTALGAGLWLSAIAVRYRDVQHLVPFAVQVGLFLSPVLYPLDLVPDRFHLLYGLNPMVGVLEVLRWCVLGTDFPGVLVLVPIATATALLVSGLLFFARAETRFADDL